MTNRPCPSACRAALLLCNRILEVEKIFRFQKVTNISLIAFVANDEEAALLEFVGMNGKGDRCDLRGFAMMNRIRLELSRNQVFPLGILHPQFCVCELFLPTFFFEFQPDLDPCVPILAGVYGNASGMTNMKRPPGLKGGGLLRGRSGNRDGVHFGYISFRSCRRAIESLLPSGQAGRRASFNRLA